MSLITDTWPACACGGKTPRALEHAPDHCAVLPGIVLAAIAGARPLTDVETVAVEQAAQRARLRGADVTAEVDAALAELPAWPSPYAPPAPVIVDNTHVRRPVW